MEELLISQKGEEDTEFSSKKSGTFNAYACDQHNLEAFYTGTKLTVYCNMCGKTLWEITFLDER